MKVTFENYPAHLEACKSALDIAVAEGLPEVTVHLETCRVVVKKTDDGYTIRCFEDTHGFKAGVFAKEAS